MSPSSTSSWSPTSTGSPSGSSSTSQSGSSSTSPSVGSVTSTPSGSAASSATSSRSHRTFSISLSGEFPTKSESPTAALSSTHSALRTPSPSVNETKSWTGRLSASRTFPILPEEEGIPWWFWVIVGVSVALLVLVVILVCCRRRWKQQREKEKAASLAAMNAAAEAERGNSPLTRKKTRKELFDELVADDVGYADFSQPQEPFSEPIIVVAGDSTRRGQLADEEELRLNFSRKMTFSGAQRAEKLESERQRKEEWLEGWSPTHRRTWRSQAGVDMMFTSAQVEPLTLEELPWLTADDIEMIRELDLQERGAVLAAAGRTVAGVAKESRFLEALEDGAGEGKSAKERSRAEEALRATASTRGPMGALARSKSPNSPPQQHLGSLSSMRRTTSGVTPQGVYSAAGPGGGNESMMMIHRLMSVVSSNSDTSSNHGGGGGGGGGPIVIGGSQLTPWERRQFTSEQSLFGDRNRNSNGGVMVVEPPGAASQNKATAVRDLFQFSPDPLQRIRNVQKRLGENGGPMVRGGAGPTPVAPSRAVVSVAAASPSAGALLAPPSAAAPTRPSLYAAFTRPTTANRIDELTFDGIELDLIDLDHDL